MSMGRWIVVAIIGITILFAAGMWYAQTRAYYGRIDSADLVVTTPTGEVLPLSHSGFQGVDADTSPLRFRACFTLDEAGMATIARAATHPDAEPLVAPAWFDCYDARALSEAIEMSEARPVMSMHEIARGVDRVFAVFPDGRGYAWHQLNGTLEE
jgi:hypothetical protein